MTARMSVISSMATRQVLAEVAPAFGLAAGCKVDVVSVGGVEAARRIRAGEAFDVVVLAGDALRRLAEDGHVRVDSLRDVALSPTALAVRAGGRRPASMDAAAIRAFVTAAASVGVSTGPSGGAVRKLLATWTGESAEQRIVEAPTGVPVARLIADGTAEIGFQQLSEMLGEPGIDIVGAMPVELQPMTVFSGAIGRAATAGDRAAKFLGYVRTATAALRRQGMEPVA